MPPISRLRKIQLEKAKIARNAKKLKKSMKKSRGRPYKFNDKYVAKLAVCRARDISIRKSLQIEKDNDFVEQICKKKKRKTTSPQIQKHLGIYSSFVSLMLFFF